MTIENAPLRTENLELSRKKSYQQIRQNSIKFFGGTTARNHVFGRENEI